MQTSWEPLCDETKRDDSVELFPHHVLGKGDESSWSEDDKSTYETGLSKAEHGN